MVKITTVTYKRLVSVEKFGNVSVEATGQLDDGEDRDAAFDELRRYVDLQVMTRKHAIEGRLGQEDGSDQLPGWVWPQAGPAPAVKPPLGPIRQMPPGAQAQPATGSGINVGSISSQQVVGPGGQVIAQARGVSLGQAVGNITLHTDPASGQDQHATALVSYPPLTVPPGGRQEVDLDPHGDALLTIYDAQDRMQGAPLTLDNFTARALIADGGAGKLDRTHTGAIAYTPSNFLTEQQPQGGWLQVREGRGVSPYDTLEYMNWGGRVSRAMAKGWASQALLRGLLVAQQGAPGLRFGVSEGAFWAAAPPTPFDDASDDEDGDDDPDNTQALRDAINDGAPLHLPEFGRVEVSLGPISPYATLYSKHGEELISIGISKQTAAEMASDKYRGSFIIENERLVYAPSHQDGGDEEGGIELVRCQQCQGSGQIYDETGGRFSYPCPGCAARGSRGLVEVAA